MASLGGGSGGRRDLNSLSYAELVHQAEEQRRRIAANNAAIQAKEARLRLLEGARRSTAGRSHAEVSHRLASLRAEASREASELQRLRGLQGQLEQQRELNLGAKSELDSLQSLFAGKEWELRSAAGRVDTLRAQLDELRRRRASAVAAGQAAQLKAKVSRNNQSSFSLTTLASRKRDLRHQPNHCQDISSLCFGLLCAPVTDEI